MIVNAVEVFVYFIQVCYYSETIFFFTKTVARSFIIMENKQYFEMVLGNDFERRFQLNGVECVVKYTSGRHQRLPHERVHDPFGYRNSRTGRSMIIIESKSDISVFVKVKFYRISTQDCVLNRSSRLSRQTMFEIYLDNLNLGSGPFICSVKVSRYEKWQNIVDSAQNMNPTENVTSKNSPRIESRLDDLSSDMKRLLEQSELSDVILSDGSKEFRAHKLILSARSKVFSKMFQHSMKENNENRVTITDVPSEVLKELLTFIYTGVINVKDMKMARDLYLAADKYDVKALRDVCSKKLKEVDLDSVLDTLALADLHGDQILKQSALDFISANYSRVKAHKKWGTFMKANQVLALEVLSFVLDKKA